MGYPAVSVIIPTYGHEHYVLDTLRSVWAQSFRNFEVIVVNDGSPDGTAKLLKPLAREGRIRYMEQSNRGQAAARNRGLAKARGEFISFLDDDDLWPPDKLDWQVRELSSAPSLGLVGGDCLKFTGLLRPPRTQGAQGTQGAPAHERISFESLFGGSPFISPGQTLIRRSVLQRIGGFDECIWGADDLDLYMRLALERTIVKHSRLALFYRCHSANASRNLRRMLINCRRVVKKHLPQVCPANLRDAQREAWHWLYRYLGKRIVSDCKFELRSGNYFRGLSQLSLLFPFLLRSILQPDLFGNFVRDVMPVRFRSHPNLVPLKGSPVRFQGNHPRS